MMTGYPAGVQTSNLVSLGNLMHADGSMPADISVDVGCLMGILSFDVGI